MKTILVIILALSMKLSAIEFSGTGKTGDNNYIVDLVVEKVVVEGIERFKLSGSILWDKGMALEFDGQGTLNRRKVLTFTFIDAFGNKGTGQLYPVEENEKTKGKNPHFVRLEATTVIEPKAARQYFDYLLTEVPQAKKEEAEKDAEPEKKANNRTLNLTIINKKYENQKKHTNDNNHELYAR